MTIFWVNQLLFWVMLNFLGCHTTTVSALKPSAQAIKQIDALGRFSKKFVTFPGQVTLMAFPYFGPFDDEKLVCNDHAIPFFTEGVGVDAMAYLARSYFDNAKSYVCELHFRDHHKSYKLKVGEVIAKDFLYPKEHLKVDQTKVVLSSKDALRAENESKMLEEVYKNVVDNALFKEPFKAPLTSKITSIYGTKRIFNGGVVTQHLGTDFRAALGTVIFSANSGRVVFVGDLFFGGNTVIVSHGLGIFTTYSHLSSIAVVHGQTVNKETVLGHSGMTGRASGPHLHWGAKVHGHWVDGASLVKSSEQSFARKSIQDERVERGL